MKLATRLAHRYELQTELSPQERLTSGRKTFLAKDTHTQETVVVKIIQPFQAVQVANSSLDDSSIADSSVANPSVQDTWHDLKLFQREADALSALDHPAIPKYKDAFELELEGTHSFALVQTYIEASSLESLITSGRRFSEDEVLAIAARMLRILHYLHTQSPPVIHRDIKPSNILVSTSSTGELGDIYLIDFGAVHTDLSKEAGTITIVGSYGYIPLEQFSGHATPASDLYSLGMTLVSLITGLHPGDIVKVKGQLQLTQLAIQPDLIAWLERMTQPYLHQRFDSAENALRALQAKSGSEGRYPHLKPEGTSIVLAREDNRLYITFNKLGEETFLLIRALYLIGTLGTLFLFLNSQIPFLSAVFPFLISQVVILNLLGRLPKRFPCTGQKTVIRFDRHHHLLIGTQKRPNWPVYWETRTSKGSRFDLLAYNPGYRFKKHTKGDQILSQKKGSVLPKLSLHNGTQAYTVVHEQLSPAEFWWLGQEIGDFLDLELQTIYPMPIVTVSTTSGCGC